MSARHQTGSEGFSLPEIMVVLVIGAIAMAVALPPFMSMLRDSQSEAAAEEIAASLRGARAKAVSQGNPFLWSYSTVSKTYKAIDDDNANGAADVGEMIYGPSPVPSCINLLSSTVTGNAVTFGSLGNANLTGNMVFSDNHGASITVSVEAATGKVSVGARKAVS
jgi:prepilin-type N-terminal cleavage/methylation domain-containing protein